MSETPRSVCTGIVVRGHGVASGSSGDPRFPEGTLRLQFPIFESLGADLNGFHPGSINVHIDTWMTLGEPSHLFRKVDWHPDVPSEDFSLWHVRLRHRGIEWPAMVYRPHPETKPEHHQPHNVIELIAPFIAGLRYGDEVEIIAPLNG
jgi:hypothetical protein